MFCILITSNHCSMSGHASSTYRNEITGFSTREKAQLAVTELKKNTYYDTKYSIFEKD